MSRAWIQSKSRISQEYKDGIKSFLDVARKHLNEDKKCRCPCKECQNGSSCLPLADIRNHIMRFGFTPSYDVWVYHGEKEMNHLNEVPEDNNVIDEEEEDEEYDNAMGYILEDFTRGLDNANGEPPTASVTDLFGEYEEKLYTGCHYSSLEAIVRLMQIKVLNHWSNKSFDAVLAYMHLMWPNLKNFPKSYYEAKKRLRNVGLGYEKIDACKYDCALFWKEHAEAENCPVCKESRYKTKKVKGKKIPHKCLRYFPLTRRLQRLYLSRHTAKELDEFGEELEHHSESVDEVNLDTIPAVKLFHDTHYSTDKGWINENAKEKYDEMVTLLANSQSSPNGPMTELQVAQVVLGTTHSYVRGLGGGEIQFVSPDDSFTSTSKDSEIKALRTELDKHEEKHKVMEDRVSQLTRMVEELRRGCLNVDSPGVAQSRDDSCTPIRTEEDHPSD